MKRWQILPEQPVPDALRQFVQGHDLIAQTLVRRGITSLDAARTFLNPDTYQPASPFDLPDMHKAVERIQRAITSGERIAVWGDFDVDGQTATSLLVDALRGLGADVTYYIPHREREGHGIFIESLARLIDDGAGVILTCDTGIAAHEAVNYANGRGVDVVITDHHQLPETLPDAYAVVNSQRVPDGHPLHTLPGVGCAFKLVEALYDAADRSDETRRFLDLVALGIVADVVVQVGDARYLLQCGLDVLRHTERLGLQRLFAKAEIGPETLDEETIGFSIAPRMNAVGRLDDANVVVEFLTTDDFERAETLANRLEGLNQDRRLRTEQVYEAAHKQIEANPGWLDFAALVVAYPDWPGGIVGIVANRLVEDFSRPVILLSTHDDAAHGSARSVPGCNITAAIAQVDVGNPDMIDGFGGHTMAAGLRLGADRANEFRRELSKVVDTMLDGVDTTPSLTIDGVLPLGDLTTDLVYDLNRLSPFGPGNPPLTLMSEKLTLKSKKPLGREGKHFRLTVEDESGAVQDVVWWRADLDRLPPGRFDLAYTIGLNTFRDVTSLQVTAVDFRAVDEEPLTFSQRRNVDVVDLRSVSETDQLAALGQYDGVLLWGEAASLDDLSLTQRDDLKPSKSLVIWTAPPAASVLAAVLELVNPAQVVLVGINPGTDAVNAFLKRFNGVVNHALSTYDGEVSLQRLAGAMAHTVATIDAGLRWMVTHGHITVIHNDGLIVRLQSGGESAGTSAKNDATNRLAEHLKEARAYRALFRSSDLEPLLAI